MIGWLDCASGVSGDMLLGALVDVGVPVAQLQHAVDAVLPDSVRLRATGVTRAGLAATAVHVEDPRSGAAVEQVAAGPPRTWADVRQLLTGAQFPGRPAALAAFGALAEAEASVHGTAVDEVHFHEVGALDAVADVVGTAAGFEYLGLDELVVSPVAVGGGTVRTRHGLLPVPVPAVVVLLRGRPTHGGPVDVELATPTGAALITALSARSGAQPPMIVQRQGVGAGGRELPDAPNVLRLLLGDPATVGADVRPGADGDVVLEANVDDLDPRVWPGVLQALLGAGADDAWLIPVLMKKGRPAHVLHALVPVHRVETVQDVLFTQTSTLGVRSHRVDKAALAREVVRVDVAGEPVRVKVGRRRGVVVNAQPEWDDVAMAAQRTGMPAKEVLARATAAYWATRDADLPVAASARAVPTYSEDVQ